MLKPLLVIQALSYAFGQRVAVNDVSFAVHRGECLGLLGPNGAGKTTTICCIAGLLSDWTGSMIFDGADFQPADRPCDRERLGIVPQESAIYAEYTAEENLRLMARLYQCPDFQETIDRLLRIAGLHDRRSDRVSTYSGGMKRRLNLSMGLVHQPELVLLDEPTVGVDPQSRNHIFDTLTELKTNGTSLLYTTHYMEEAQRLCDRVAIMNDGRIIACGTSSELAEQSGAPDADLETVFLKLTGRRLRD